MLSFDELSIIQDFFRKRDITCPCFDRSNTVYSSLLKQVLSWATHKKPTIIGIAGSNGSGKSTLAQLLAELLKHHSIHSIALSIDDFLLPQSTRKKLAANTHPLLQTRSVGTLDVPLLFHTLQSLKHATPTTVKVPRFSKVCDDRLPEKDWGIAPNPVHIILFEGFCLKAKPQTPTELNKPINPLEAEQDPNVIWRTIANDTLRDLQPSFDLIDHLIYLKVNEFNGVINNRYQTELTLNKASPDYTPLSKSDVTEFLMHHERIFHSQLKHLPTVADRVIEANDLRG